jgi:hypothetical protein
MSSRNALIIRITIILVIYFILHNPVGRVQFELFQAVLYPIRNFVTFLHEFGHASGALITGGSVISIEIHSSGGGLAWTRGGNRAVTIMGGYLGSALFGNLLFYIGAKKPKWVKPTLSIVILAMLITGFLWYKTLYTTALLCIFAGALFVIGFKTKFGRDALMFLGLASVLYIIQNFNIGPRSDLSAFETEIGILPSRAWMYVWLTIALIFLAINLKMLFNIKQVKPSEKAPPRKRINTARRYNPIKKE